jgi:metal-responsive CopG/Arc/MetJ family transcriptional regulator
VTAIDAILDKSTNRSALIEVALRAYLAQKAKESREDKDLKILNKNSERLNREAEDVLSYQVEL